MHRTVGIVLCCFIHVFNSGATRKKVTQHNIAHRAEDKKHTKLLMGFTTIEDGCEAIPCMAPTSVYKNNTRTADFFHHPKLNFQ